MGQGVSRLGIPMRKSYFGLLSLTLAGALAVTSANAADVYGTGPASWKDPVYAPITSWTGFYAGFHMGGALGDLNVTDHNKNVTFQNEPSDIFIGGQVGYNLQMNNLVLGVEADFGQIAFSNATNEPGSGGAVKSSIDRGLYGDVTGRIGYSFSRSLLYAKGGLAVYDGDISITDSVGKGVTKSDALTGWTLGGGVEQKFAPNWSVKAEYQYFDFGSEDIRTSDNRRFTNELTAHTAKIGVNYLFSYQNEPLK
jgi:outer membrane immunogenic protein